MFKLLWVQKHSEHKSPSQIPKYLKCDEGRLKPPSSKDLKSSQVATDLGKSGSGLAPREVAAQIEGVSIYRMH